MFDRVEDRFEGKRVDGEGIEVVERRGNQEVTVAIVGFTGNLKRHGYVREDCLQDCCSDALGFVIDVRGHARAMEALEGAATHTGSLGDMSIRY